MSKGTKLATTGYYDMWSFPTSNLNIIVRIEAHL